MGLWVVFPTNDLWGLWMPLNCDVYNYVAREKVYSSNIMSLGISVQWVGGETQSALETLHYSFTIES